MDWSGHVLRDPSWRHLCIPMEHEQRSACACADCSAGATVFGWRDPRTVEGEPLHPERFPPDVLAAERVRLGSYGYAGQMQQRPAPAEGGMFRKAWWRFWKPDGVGADAVRPDGCYTGPARALPKLERVAISLDATFKDGASTDYVCALVIGAHKADRFIIDRVKRHMGFVDTLAMMRDLRTRHPSVTKVLIEDKANGSAIVDVLTKEIGGVIAVNPGGSKEARAGAISPQVEAGNVHLPDGAPWVDDFIGELAAFPNGAHDDQVDALSQGLKDMGTLTAADRARALAQW
jgi:predicted phage terminase large subunit-like protein